MSIMEDCKEIQEVEECAVSKRCKSNTGLILILVGCCCFACGLLLGIHWRVIKALIKGEPLPEPPAWHVWCRKKD